MGIFKIFKVHKHKWTAWSLVRGSFCLYEKRCIDGNCSEKITEYRHDIEQIKKGECSYINKCRNCDFAESKTCDWYVENTNNTTSFKQERYCKTCGKDDSYEVATYI